MWSWKNEKGDYVPYSGEASSEIESVYAKDENAKAALTVKGVKYEVCLRTLMQKNVGTGTTTCVQRLAVKRAREEEKVMAVAHVPVPAVEGAPRVLVFPSISTAIFMFDVDKAADVACEVIQRFLTRFSGPRYASLRLVLVDIPASGKSKLEDSEALFAFSKRWSVINKSGETRFSIKVANITDNASRGPAVAIANATNATFAGGLATGGVNRAIHVAAGPELQEDSRKAHGKAVPGNAYTVALRPTSGLYTQGVRHVVHVLGPNMNPTRADCLHGDYMVGCKQLKQCYEGLFNAFIALYFPDE